MTTSCAVCGSSRNTPLYPQIVRCSECHHVYADIQLSHRELEDIYRRNYFFGDEYIDYVADKKVIQKNFQLRFKVLQKYLQPDFHQHLLEIGSAYGFFLDLVKGHFQSVRGFDITEEGVIYAKDQLHLDVLQQDFLEAAPGSRKYQVVCLWDTIEHLSNPQLYIEKAGQWLEQGGLLAITTGDIDSLNAKMKKQHWRLIHPPTHLHYFSKNSLQKLLNKYGFETCYAKHCGFYRSLDNMAYGILVLRHQSPKLYQAFKKSRLLNWDLYLNLYDIIYVIARKK